MTITHQTVGLQKPEFLANGRQERPRLYLIGAAYICAATSFDLHFTKGAIANILLSSTLAALVIYHYVQGRSVVGLEGPGRTTLLAHDWLYLSFVGFILLSTVWSVAPLETIAQGVPLIVPWLSALLLCSLNPEWVAGFVVKFAVVAAVLSLLVIRIDPVLAFQPVSAELRGIFAHQLFLGAFLAVAIGLILISWLNGQLRQVLGKLTPATPIILILLGGVAVYAWARLFTVAAIAAFVLTWFFSRRGSRKIFAFIIFPCIGYGVASNFDRISEYLRAGGTDVTLNGRTIIWEKTLAAMRPDTATFGHGFGTFQLPMFDNLWTFFRPWRPWHAHNCFMNVYFELGRIGLIIVVVLIIVQLNAAWRYSARSNKYSYSMFLIFFCTFGGLVNGREYDGFITPSFCLMLVFLAIESRAKLAPPRNRLAPKVVP